jgi:hypothetical protein
LAKTGEDPRLGIRSVGEHCLLSISIYAIIWQQLLHFWLSWSLLIFLVFSRTIILIGTKQIYAANKVLIGIWASFHVYFVTDISSWRLNWLALYWFGRHKWLSLFHGAWTLKTHRHCIGDSSERCFLQTPWMIYC